MLRSLKKYCFFIILTGYGNQLFAQHALLAKGDKQYEKYEYINAQKTYLQVAQTGYQSKKLLMNLGNTYYYNSEFTEALPWYRKLIISYGGSIDSEYYYRYAQTLKSAGDYKQADLYMTAFAATNPEDKRAVLFLKKKEKLEKAKALERAYTITNLSMNSDYRDFGASYYGKYVVFSSSRNDAQHEDVHEWNNEPYLDLYIAICDQESGELYEVEKWNHSLNSDLHESSPVFTNDNQTVYYSGNEVENKAFRKKKNKEEKIRTNTLEIYRSTLDKNGQWSTPEVLPFCKPGYSTSHPTLSADGTKMYFSSDMPGGKGASDIYVVDIYADGSFGEPQNLLGINTEGKDTFPFISAEDKLYFSSDGHVGLGGLDIFITDMKEYTDQDPVVLNLGEPINSKGDDFGLVMHPTGKKGYFSSNREAGKGNDDIYRFTEKPEIILQRGDDLAKKLRLHPIYFDLDKSFIRPDAAVELDKIVAIMKEHPSLKVAIRSHTDSRALMWYNVKLSQRRASSTKRYLIQNGISADRLTAHGYGELELVNHCSDDVPCSEEEHQRNRRSEFIIVAQ